MESGFILAGPVLIENSKHSINYTEAHDTYLIFPLYFLLLLNLSSQLHSILPANGAPVSRQRTSRVKELYYDYVRERTLQNWKFWIVSEFI